MFSTHNMYKSLQRWDCSFCSTTNTAFEKYCVNCTSPRDTGLTIPNPDAVPDYRYHEPNYTQNQNANPFYTPEPQLPFSDTANQSEDRAQLESSFIVIDDPPNQTNPNPQMYANTQEILDGPSVCIPSRQYVYPGENELLESIEYGRELPGTEEDFIEDISLRPSAPISQLTDSFNYQSEYDYSFMHAAEIQQLHSIREFISNSAVPRKETPDGLDSEEMRFSLTASAKVEALEKLTQTTDPTYNPYSTPASLYPLLDSIAAREDKWSEDPINPYSVIPVPLPADIPPDIVMEIHSIPPVPYPRNIDDIPKHPVPAPRKTSQSSLVAHKTSPEPMETIADPPTHTHRRKVNSVRQENKIIGTLTEEKLKVEEIISFLVEQKMDFIDPSFFPSPRSLFINPQTQNKDRLRKITWLRPRQIRTQAGRKLKWSVTNHPNPADVCQGVLGNCWFLSALSVVAEKEKLIDNLLITKEINEHGVYQVCLCMCGKWEIVTIDDSFPCRSDYKTQIYSEAMRNQLWVCLIEKAAAKLYGCYESLNRGTLIEGLSTLTGAPCETLYLADMLQGRRVDPNEAMNLIWAQITYFKNADFLMGVSTGNQEISEEVYQGVGLSSQHAYSVLSVSEMEGNKLLCLRDPTGSSRWKGDWSNRSPKWTKEMRKKLTPGGEGGIFWISLDDLCNYFTAVDICKVKLDYNEARESAVFPPFLECHTPVYLVELFDNTELDVCLYQPNKRYKQNDKNESVVDFAGQPTDLSVILLKTEEDVEEGKGSSAPNPTKLAGFIGRKKQSCVSQSFKLEPGFYLIVPQAYSHWNTEYIIPYTIATFSSKAHLLETRPSRPGFFTEALFILVKAKGKHTKTPSPSINQYRLYDNFFGDILIIENRSEYHYNLRIDGSSCHNVVATRGSTTTQDCIPPRHKQIINILTYDDLSRSCGIDYAIMTSVSVNNSNGGYGSICYPELTNKNRELHSPIYI